MKVTLTKETRPSGDVWFYIHSDEHIVESFSGSREKEAREYFDAYGKHETKIEVLETKEI